MKKVIDLNLKSEYKGSDLFEAASFSEPLQFSRILAS